MCNVMVAGQEKIVYSKPGNGGVLCPIGPGFANARSVDGL